MHPVCLTVPTSVQMRKLKGLLIILFNLSVSFRITIVLLSAGKYMCEFFLVELLVGERYANSLELIKFAFVFI